MTTFLSLFIVFDIVYMVYMLSRPAAARRKMQREKERQAAERQAKAEARKQEQAAAKANKAAKAAAQPPRKRGRPRKNPPKQPAAARKQAKPAAPVPAEQPAPVPVEPKPVNNAPKTGAFAGEVVAFTGTCPKMERRYMVSHVNRLGGQGYETITPAARCWLSLRIPAGTSLTRPQDGTSRQSPGRNGGNALSTTRHTSNPSPPKMIP